jgi:hypothetical protein
MKTRHKLRIIPDPFTANGRTEQEIAFDPSRPFIFDYLPEQYRDGFNIIVASAGTVAPEQLKSTPLDPE